jgi:two-component system, sensor histidine kinase
MRTIRDYVAQTPPLLIGSKGFDALARFDADRTLTLLAVLDTAGKVCGLLKRSTFLSALAQGFGREIYLPRAVGLLMQPALVVVEAGLSIDAVAWALSEADSNLVAPGAVILEGGKYLGVVESDKVYRALTRSLDEKAALLNKALGEAEAARDAKSNFLSAMSHEIRTPLNGILGMTQALMATDLDNHQNELISVVAGSGEVLLRLLDDVLEMSKIESGKLQLEPVPVNITDVLRTATALFSERAQAKGLVFKTNFDGVAAGWFEADSARLKQVLYNIVSNAVKFTQDGTVSVRAETLPNPDGGEPVLEICVTDSGIGMSEDAIARLFRPFEQADASTTRRYGGSGLGLSICKSLIEMMRGEILVRSAPGDGSEFTVRIPLLPADTGRTVTAEPSARPTPAVSGDPTSDGQTISVLAAEDNLVNQKVLSTLLQPFGFVLTFADNGAFALEAFKARRFDLVLMDLQMPVMSGLESAMAMRAYEADAGLAPTPILALSANAMHHHVREALDAGMNGHVGKPISLPVLLEAISSALEPGPERRADPFIAAA